MLLFDNIGLADAPAAWAEVEKLEALAHDLRRMLRGDGPSSGELDTAPLISSWIAVDREVPALVGKVGNHPILHGSRTVQTSEVVVWNVHKGWVRTSSRYYKLGEVFGPNKSRTCRT